MDQEPEGKVSQKGSGIGRVPLLSGKAPWEAGSLPLPELGWSSWLMLLREIKGDSPLLSFRDKNLPSQDSPTCILL